MSFDNPSCQHYRIDNTTARCVECNEQMVTIESESVTVRSAPNAAPCTDPAHLAAIEAGEDFECHAPYIPDESRAIDVVLHYAMTYRCARCENDGTLITTRAVIWDCGHSHRGKSIPAGETMPQTAVPQ